MDQNAAFGEWLRQLRKARDLTQAALAQQTYCALDTIKKLETGVRRPSRELAIRVADCLDLSGDVRAAFLAAARANTGAETGATAMLADSLLASVPPRHSPLPAQPTPLIGREPEVASVVDLLRRVEVRLVT